MNDPDSNHSKLRTESRIGPVEQLVKDATT